MVESRIFKKRLWYIYKGNNPEVFEISLNQANTIIGENKQGKKPISLEEVLGKEKRTTKKMKNIIEEQSINRFDKKKPIKKRK